MSAQPENLSTVHCILFPLFVLASSDGEFAEDETKDIISTAVTLSDLFGDLTAEQAVEKGRECAEWFDSLSPKEQLNVACWCCGEVHNDLAEGPRENVIKWFDDQIKADGKVTEVELSLHKLFSGIIRKGLES